jgi:hypothetical protein
MEIVKKPWGSYQRLHIEPGMQVKRVETNPDWFLLKFNSVIISGKMTLSAWKMTAIEGD